MQDVKWASVAPIPRVWLGPREGGVLEDGFTAIWGPQVLMGREARDIPGRGWGGMLTLLLAFPSPPGLYILHPLV